MALTTPPMITDELPSDTPVSGGSEQIDALRGAAMLDLFALVQHQDLVIALFVPESRISLYGRIYAMEEQFLTLELFDQADIPDALIHAQIQAIVRIANKQLKFETRFAGYEEGDTITTLIRLHMPKQCAFVQRRNAFRLNLLPLKAVSCFISAHGDEIEISVADISLGGIGLLGVVPGMALQAGTRLNGARLELSSGSCLIVDLEVCSQADYFLKNGIKTIRTGTRFVQLSPRSTQALALYINRTSALLNPAQDSSA